MTLNDHSQMIVYMFSMNRTQTKHKYTYLEYDFVSLSCPDHVLNTLQTISFSLFIQNCMEA